MRRGGDRPSARDARPALGRLTEHAAQMQGSGVLRLDEEGRPLRSVYPSQGLEERYRYDGAGRLIEITGVMAAVGAGRGADARGTLHVEHARGPLAIRAEGHTVWERIDEPWPELLAREAREIAAGLIDSIGAHVAQPGIEVFALSLT